MAAYSQGEGGGGGAPVFLENDVLSLEFDPATTGIILRDKAAGTEWRSSPENAASDPLADTYSTPLLQSPFLLTYANDAGIKVSLSAFADSIEKGQYEYALADGGLEVNYTVGKVDRTYYIPPAAPEARFNAFLDKMDGAGRSRVQGGYRLYDIDNLVPSDNRGELLRDYPDLADGKVWILRIIPEYMKTQFEDIFAAAGYTPADYEEDASRCAALAVAEQPGFNLTLRYELDGGSLLVSVPFDRISYRKGFPLTDLTVLPLMGAGGLADQGYALVPDGSGALVRFNNGKQSQNALELPLYGWDEGQYRAYRYMDNRASFPVFGIEKNGESLLCLIEEGAPYASVLADVSGRNSSYNSVSARFTVVHGGEVDITRKGRTSSGLALYRYEAEPAAGEGIVLRYTPCAGGYVGMAKAYRSYLREKYPALGKGRGVRPGDGSLPVAVEILGAVEKTQHIVGLPFVLPLPLTGYAEAEGMIRDFAAWGWEKARIKLNGWFNGGLTHSLPVRIRLVDELGNSAAFESLLAAAASSGYEVYGEADFYHIKKWGPFDGFNLNRDTARRITRERAVLPTFSPVWFFSYGRNDKEKSYLVRPAYFTELARNFAGEAEKRGIRGVAFRTLGNRLAADYREDDPVSRTAAMNIRQELLAELAAGGTGIMISEGHDYAVPWADFITGMPLSSQGFGICDEAVPFYQIALHGLVPYTGKAVNLAENYTRHLLQTVESGAGLYFSFMTEPAAVLQETLYVEYYSNEYGQWAAAANDLYRSFAQDFDGLWTETIENHEILAPGVTVTGYSNGVQVYVNAGSEPYRRDGVEVGAKSYTVIKERLPWQE
jgi:hypothetical protein